MINSTSSETNVNFNINSGDDGSIFQNGVIKYRPEMIKKLIPICPILPKTSECIRNFVASAVVILEVACAKKAWAKPVPKPIVIPIKWTINITSRMIYLF